MPPNDERGWAIFMAGVAFAAAVMWLTSVVADVVERRRAKAALREMEKPK